MDEDDAIATPSGGWTPRRETTRTVDDPESGGASQAPAPAGDDTAR